MANNNSNFDRRKARTRYALKQASNRARLSVFRSNQNIYAQIIDDQKGQTLASASTLDKDLKLKNGGNVEAAEKVGELIAKRAKSAGVAEVIFDRGGYLFHGRVKALATGARSGGLKF